MTLLDLARKFRYVRELPENRGQRVEAIQKWCGGKSGDSWCCHFATMILDIWYEGKSPIPRTGSCDVVLETARQDQRLSEEPRVGDLYLRLRAKHDANHIGIVTDVSQWDDNVIGTLSGNTSPDGLSSNGDGVYERAINVSDRTTIIFVRHAA